MEGTCKKENGKRDNMITKERKNNTKPTSFGNSRYESRMHLRNSSLVIPVISVFTSLHTQHFPSEPSCRSRALASSLSPSPSKKQQVFQESFAPSLSQVTSAGCQLARRVTGSFGEEVAGVQDKRGIA